jgi:hypothetical protein
MDQALIASYSKHVHDSRLPQRQLHLFYPIKVGECRPLIKPRRATAEESYPAGILPPRWSNSTS